MAEAIQIPISAMLSSGFQSVFSRAEGNVDQLGNSVAKLSSTVGQVGSYRALRLQTEQLAESLAKARSEQEAIRKQIEATGKPTKEQTAALREADKQVKALEKSYEKANEALRKSGDELKAAKVDVANLTSEEKRLNEELERQKSGMAARDTLRHLFGADGEKKVKTFGEALGNVRDKSVSAFRDIGAVTVAAGAGIFALANSTAEYGDEVAETAMQIGISTSALQEFRAVGRTVGVTTEAMDTALGKFSVNLGKAAENGEKGRESFREMGLDLDQLIKLGPEKSMMKVAEAISRMPSHAKRAATAVEIFGKSGLGMLKILSNGEQAVDGFYNSLGGGYDALAKARQQIRDTGSIMSEEDIAKAGAYDDAMNRMKGTMLGLRNTIGIGLVPTITDMMTKVSDFVDGHGPEIRAFAEKLGTEFAKAAPKIMDVASGFASFAGTLFHAAEGAANFLGGWDNLMIAVAGVRLIPVAVSIFQLGQTLFTAGRAVMTLLPAIGSLTGMAGTAGAAVGGATGSVGGLAAAIAALGTGPVIVSIGAVVAGALLIYKYWDYVRGFFIGAAEGMGEALSPITDGFKPLIDGLLYIKDLFVELLEPVTASKEGFASAISVGKTFGQVIGASVRVAMFPLEMMLKTISAISTAAGWIGKKLGLNDGQTEIPQASMTEEGRARIERMDAAKVGAIPKVVPNAGANVSKTEHNTFTFHVDGSKDPGATAEAVRREFERMQMERAANSRSSYLDQGAY